jgi:hypothetical protein
MKRQYVAAITVASVAIVGALSAVSYTSDLASRRPQSQLPQLRVERIPYDWEIFLYSTGNYAPGGARITISGPLPYVRPDTPPGSHNPMWSIVFIAQDRSGL